jgi:hypothetical protein
MNTLKCLGFLAKTITNPEIVTELVSLYEELMTSKKFQKYLRTDPELKEKIYMINDLLNK